VVGGNVSIRFGALLKGKPPFFERSDDLTARFGRNENVVGEIRGDEKDGAKVLSGMAGFKAVAGLTFQPKPVDSSAPGPFDLHRGLLLLQK
jgi:hypothetical protein